MKLKKYTAATEREALEQIKTELGPDALVLSIKKIRPTGFLSFLRKQSVELTAAYEEKDTFVRQNTAPENPADSEKEESGRKIRELEGKLSGAEALLGTLINRLSIAERAPRGEDGQKYENTVIQLFYETLTKNGVTPEVADAVLADADAVSRDENENIDINLLTRIVYNTIISVAGQPKIVQGPRGLTEPAKRVFFIGPTGVGKTTTIAKITSSLILEQKKRVGLITADTYRIAAVEQLKTYAEILGVDIAVVYGAEDLQSRLEDETDDEIVIIDTAGRSHRNAAAMDELKQMLDAAPDSDKFLVLSLNMKYEDMLEVVTAYSAITDFALIFTKLDETAHIGAVLNICSVTSKPLAYFTDGQNVPDDIRPAAPETLARVLLGMGGGFHG